jgi:hypothetical protein
LSFLRTAIVQVELCIILSLIDMKNILARELIAKELVQYRKKSYIELRAMIHAQPITYEIVGPDGKKYQIEIQAFWDDKPDGDIRVMGSIDDTGWRAIFPLNDGFIKSPSGKFIGE